MSPSDPLPQEAHRGSPSSSGTTPSREHARPGTGDSPPTPEVADEIERIRRKRLKDAQRAGKAQERLARAISEGLDRRSATLKERLEGHPKMSGNGEEGADPALEALDDILNTPLGSIWLRDSLPVNAGTSSQPTMPGVVAPLPRRRFIRYSEAIHNGAPAMARSVTFEAGMLHSIARLGLWLLGALRFLGGTLFDKLLGRDTLDRRAFRLRRTLEDLGATFIKLGQQLSVRADILPFKYCEELAKMLDDVKAFPSEKAIEAIERVNGRKITEVFAVFDPNPIGSASLACVYQAILPSGEKVAVKVRRPGVGDTLAADLRALGWLMGLAETLTLIRPGMTRNLRTELHTMLFEELNYFMEARYTEIFARRARKKRQTYIEAPKVYFDLSGEDVLVTEFVSGVFLWEVLSAIDRKDENALADLRMKGIDPVILAKRMIRAFNWETFESLFFHADPHPANIVIRPDNTLVFIDFGSCGHFSSRMKRLWQRLQYHIDAEDVGGMVEASIALLEPLPPIDIDRFTKEMEALYWDWLYATKSKNSEWWERCTGQMWLKFIGLSRRYNVPMNLETLRLFRATFLYDSIAMRLWESLDMSREYIAYSKERGRRARKRVRQSIRRRLEKGPTKRDYLQLEDLWRFSNQMMNRAQHFLDSPNHRFASMLSKAAFSITMTLRFLTLGAAAHVVAIFAIGVTLYAETGRADLQTILGHLANSTAYRVSVAIALLIIIRKSIMRLEDIDVEKR